MEQKIYSLGSISLHRLIIESLFLSQKYNLDNFFPFILQWDVLSCFCALFLAKAPEREKRQANLCSIHNNMKGEQQKTNKSSALLPKHLAGFLTQLNRRYFSHNISLSPLHPINLLFCRDAHTTDGISNRM
jgi:hypothetical protein